MELSELHESILDAYTVESFRRFLSFELDKNIDSISRGGDFRTVAFDVLQEAQRSGWIDRLLDAIINDKPNNPKVRELSSIDDGDLMDRDTQTKLIQDISYLSNAIFGIPGMDSTGIVKHLEAIDSKLKVVMVVFPFMFLLDVSVWIFVIWMFTRGQ